ncbi:hypothetical protein KY306_02300 [Candidatus Woesearchaeota archaeon]|nr:hypothetical protein [Candidatus Woesearchaeota archaeon]
MENTDKSWNHVFEQTETLLYKKAEEIIESLTEQEREKLEAQGIVLDLEEVFRLIEEKLIEHFDSKEFTVEHIKKDIQKLTKKDIFDL